MSDGVEKFTAASVTVGVYFPDGHIACQFCPLFCRYEENFKRYSCRLTGEWLLTPMLSIGDRCPLEIEKEDK